MRLTIKRRDGELFEFSMPDNGGYIRIETSDGRNYRQICEGGQFFGATIQGSPRDFKIICRRWYRAFNREAS